MDEVEKSIKYFVQQEDTVRFKDRFLSISCDTSLTVLIKV